MIRQTIVIAIALVGVTPVIAQNLLVNPTFDIAAQLDGWTCTSSDGLASWNVEDRTGSPGSGSLQHDVDGAGNNAKIWCVQCVPVTEMRGYVASAWHFWPDDPDVMQVGTTRLSVYYYDDTDCTSLVEIGANVTGNHPLLDTWYHIQTDESVAPAGTVSALVYFITWQNFTGQPVRARLDDLDFSSTPLFSDDFETGGVGAWSSSTP